MQKFLVGVNYWPVSKGMAMWRLFDPGEVREDMARMSDMKLSPVRIFLLWEDFQPDPRRINLKALDHLADTARFADDAGVNLWVTLFTGHMSGANWFPEWMLDLSGSGEIFFRSPPAPPCSSMRRRTLTTTLQLLLHKNYSSGRSRRPCEAIPPFGAGIWAMNHPTPTVPGHGRRAGPG